MNTPLHKRRQQHLRKAETGLLLTELGIALALTGLSSGDLRQFLWLLLALLLGTILGGSAIIFEGMISSNTQMTPNAKAQAPPQEPDVGCNDDVQISWSRQN